MTVFSSLASPLAMPSSLWAAAATLAILTISVLAMSSSFWAPAATLSGIEPHGVYILNSECTLFELRVYFI